MRHLLKSLVMTLVVTAGAVLAMLILLNHSFFDARVNTLTFWCIVVLLACIWGAFIGEVRETTSQQKPQKPADSDAMEKLVDAAALNEAQTAAAGAVPVVELTLQCNGAVICDFRQGNATITIPHTLAQGQQAEGVVVWYLDEEGGTTACQTSYDEAAGDPDNGIAPGTKWEDLPDDFVCPLCGVGKDQFSAE